MGYLEADSEYFRIFENHASDVFSKLSSKYFPNTYRAMAMFVFKTNSLKTAMYDCIESNNPYAFKVLFRCFCEHYLKFLYIWIRYFSENNDAVGTEYYSFCGAAEARDYASAISLSEALLGKEGVKEFEKIIADLYPEAAKLSIKELEQASGRFKYRAILRFLASDELRFITKNRPFLARVIPSYALLSSFVHGGPYTDMEMFEYSKPNALTDCKNDAEIVFLMSATVFMLTSAAISKAHPDLIPITSKVKAVVDRFLLEPED